MKNQLTVETKVVKKYGVTAAVVLAVINHSYEPMTTTEMANAIGVSYPTAQKNLQILAASKLVKSDGKAFSKI